jgi:hypothetical protein
MTSASGAPALLRMPVELLNKVEPGYRMQRIAWKLDERLMQHTAVS